MSSSDAPIDVALIGGGIMSATLGTMLKQLEPDWTIQVFEKLGSAAEESSNPWNNAGTGHAALCELNYTPQLPDGSISIAGAVKVNEQFQVSRQFWSHLVENGSLPEPASFINPTPHMSFVWGESNVEFLRKRYAALKDHPLFQGLEYSEDASVIRGWAPLLIPGRAKSQPIAATHIKAGTDVNFGSLTQSLLTYLEDNGAEITNNAKVTGLKRQKDGLWRITYRREVGFTPFVVRARFVFVGAGGGALSLLQKSGIPEIRGYGGFPVSGEFLRSDNQELVARHQAKVYGMAAVGAPPMSVPHLDTRVIDGNTSLMFGPYAGFSPKFLKNGSLFDLFASIRPHNLVPMIAAGASNLSLVRYLLGQLLAKKSTKFAELQQFFPHGEQKDWYRITAGQRVQIIKKDPKKGGVLQFGTEVVAAEDGSIAGLLGASPGASTAAPIMLGLIEKCFPEHIDNWRPRLEAMVPSFGTQLSDDPKLADEIMTATASTLRIPR
ncbi:malate dehydrogenase (quinone) [Conyzicola nivalis]|uniref:Probable malate:quinone oxidoreductase n=1 Tax=Conyzicola nivalis TaxID=1477021 RepID=A0ABV2QRI5_9MICO